MADLAATGRADAAGLADGEGGEVVVKEEILLVRTLQGIDELLVFGGAQGGNDDRLCLAAGEEGGAVGPGKDADLGEDRTDVRGRPSVDPATGLENLTADDLGLEFLQQAADDRDIDRIRRVLTGELLLGGGLHLAELVRTLLLVGEFVGSPQAILGLGADPGHDVGEIRRLVVPRLLRATFGEGDDEVDDVLGSLVAFDHGAEHDLLGELLGFGLDHHHGVRRAGHHQVELGAFEVLDGRVDGVVTILVGDPRRTDRPHEGDARNGEGRGGRDHRDDVGIVLEVVTENGADDLHFVLEAGGEERADRTVDETRGKGLLFRRPAFALEEAAGDAACGVALFLVVHGQREEVLPRPGLALADHGREDGGFAVGRKNRPIGLTGDPSGFEGQLTACPGH